MIEQTIVTKLLSQAVQNKRENHLYILVGDDLEKQRSIYHWFIQLHLCETLVEGQPCLQCASCQQVLHDNYVNSTVIQLEGKTSLGIDAMRLLKEQFMVSSLNQSWRFFCIEAADVLTIQAANSILKFLEEPTANTIGFLFVQNEQALLETIQSRAQILRLEQENQKLEPIANEALRQNFLRLGIDEKQVEKHFLFILQGFERYFLKLANGSPIIVALTDLEEIMGQTKLQIDILKQLLFFLKATLTKQYVFTQQAEKLSAYINRYGANHFVALETSLKNITWNASVQNILVTYALKLEDKIA